MKTFKVLREIIVGDKTYFPNDTVKETDDRDWGAIERMGLVSSELDTVNVKDAKVEPLQVKQSNIETKSLTNHDKSDNDKPIIKPAGKAWFKVYVGHEVIGKAVRTREEAQDIVDEWHDKKK